MPPRNSPKKQRSPLLTKRNNTKRIPVCESITDGNFFCIFARQAAYIALHLSIFLLK